MLHINDRPDAPGTGQNNLKQLFAGLYNHYHQMITHLKKAQFLAPLIFRLFLTPIFLTFGINKAMHFESTVQWFGNSEWGLGLPMPALLAFLAISAEIIGGICLLFGFLTRIVSIPLIITMIVAIFTAHIDNGWNAIAPSDPQTNIAQVTQHIGFPGAKESLQNSVEVKERLQRMRAILKEHGNYRYLTEKGSVVILNNGIEFAVIYLSMLLSLLFTGAGKLSLDYLFTRNIVIPNRE